MHAAAQGTGCMTVSLLANHSPLLRLTSHTAFLPWRKACPSDTLPVLPLLLPQPLAPAPARSNLHHDNGPSWPPPPHLVLSR